MGKDISLILASGKSLTSIIKAGQDPDSVRKIVEAVDPPTNSYYEDFPGYIKDILTENDFNDTSDFNKRIGFVASWILASVKPAWYLRNCSVSLFLESRDASPEQWAKYTSDWKTNTRDMLPNVDIANHFSDANYSLGCLISPRNCGNFIADYRSDTEFKRAVDRHFGIFVAGLFDALQTSIETNTDLVEAMDIFVVYMTDPKTHTWQFHEHYAYTTYTYDETNIALQAFSIEAQVYRANAKAQQHKGDEEKAELYLEAQKGKIDMMVRNGNAYVDRIRTRTNLQLPNLTSDVWL